MALVVGLGNPGRRYAHTRHNVGWRVLDQLVERWRAGEMERAAGYRAWQVEHEGKAVVLLAPLRFMNLSGEALLEWEERHGVERDDLLVVADDVYLPVGHLRLRARGSSGGHRGLESIEKALGTRDYARLRIGVGEVTADALGEHVLSEIEADEQGIMNESIGIAADAVECWLRDGLTTAMNRFNRRVSKEVPES